MAKSANVVQINPESEEPDYDNLLDFEDIVKADDTQPVPFLIPEWPKNGKPGVLLFIPLSAEEAIKFAEENKTPNVAKSSTIRLIMKSAVNKDRTPKFDDPKMLQAMLKKSMKVYNRMAQFVMDLNGFSKKAQEVLKNESS
jgi:hypothetical protein